MRPTVVRRVQHERGQIRGNYLSKGHSKKGHIQKRSYAGASHFKCHNPKWTSKSVRARSPSHSRSRSPHRTSKVTKQLRKLFLTKVKTIQSKAKLNTSKLFEEITCAVCRFTHQDPYKIVPCGHSFCNWCLTEWLKQNATCPMCRCRPTIFRKDREVRAKVDYVCGRLSNERQMELGYGRKLSEQQYCLLSHKMRLNEFFSLVPQSASSQKEADERREREYREYEFEVSLLRDRIQNLRGQQEQLMRRRRRQINSVVERFETVLEALDHQEELLTLQLEQQQFPVYT